MTVRLGYAGDDNGDHLCLKDSGASHLFWPLELLQDLPNLQDYIIKRKPIIIQTGKGRIQTDNAIIAVVPLTFCDIEGAFHTIHTQVVGLEEINSIYIGSSLLYDMKKILGMITILCT